MNSIKISVVTVSYNAVETIEKTILSVLNQTYSNIEYIIIDGGSTDGTIDIIKKYSDKISYCVSEPDNGIYDAMNKGIAAASGDYVNFMNAGDTFYDSNCIASVFSHKPKDDVIYGETINISDYCSYLERCLPLERMSEILPFSHQSTFVRSVLLKEKLFNTTYRSAADYELLYHLWSENRSFKYTPYIIAIFDTRDGFSAINKSLVLKEVSQINGSIKDKGWILKYNIISLKYRLKSIIKNFLPKIVIKRINILNIGKNPRYTIREIY